MEDVQTYFVDVSHVLLRAHRASLLFPYRVGECDWLVDVLLFADMALLQLERFWTLQANASTSRQCRAVLCRAEGSVAFQWVL